MAMEATALMVMLFIILSNFYCVFILAHFILDEFASTMINELSTSLGKDCISMQDLLA